MDVPTMRIKGGSASYIVINVSDFDPSTMERYDDPPSPDPPAMVDVAAIPKVSGEVEEIESGRRPRRG
jgi:hypothetical protein